MFRMPDHAEVKELMKEEGLPAYIALGSDRGFAPKRLCLDSSGSNLYVLEPDSTVPSYFFGMSGFGLQDLRRVIHSANGAPQPTLSLEFDDGYLLLKLAQPVVLQGLLGALTKDRDDVWVDARDEPDWG